MKKNTKFFLIIIGFIFTFLILLPLFVHLVTEEYWNLVDLNNKSSFGDALGGLTAPFIGTIGVILTFIAFYVQYEFNKTQHNFIKKQILYDNMANYNHSFDLIIKWFHGNFPLIMLENNSINSAIGLFINDKQVYETECNLKGGEHAYTYFIMQNEFMHNPTNYVNIKYDVDTQMNQFNTVRKFINFIDLLKDELKELEISEEEVFKIIVNYFKKIAIAIAPEIIPVIIWSLINVNIPSTNKKYILDLMKINNFISDDFKYYIENK